MDDLFNGPVRQRRAINLGGAAAASQRDVYEQAKASRLARLEERRRQDAATTIQALWRGVLDRRRLYPELRRRIGEDIAGLDAMKCLALLPADDEALGQWSHAMCAQKDPFALSRSSQQKSWLVLMRQIEVRLLAAISNTPLSPSSVYHARILNLLFTKLGDPGITRDLLQHLLQRDYYNLLSTTLSKLGVEAKKSPILPPVVSLITVPFAIWSGDNDNYATCLCQCLRYILTLPLLPNRFPIASLTEFSSRLPLSSINLVDEFTPELASSLGPPEKAHLLANLVAFMPPRYAALHASALKTYLRLLTLTLSGLAPNALEPPPSTAKDVSAESASWMGDDEDVLVEIKPVAAPNTITLDNKSRTRLETLTQPGHLQSLLSASAKHTSSKTELYSFLLLLWSVWPARKDKFVSSVLASSGDGFIRELYRLHVRPSPLGKTDEAKSFKDPALAHHWPSFLCLTEMYTQLLLTMGDDEFFASSSASTSSSSQRVQSNPLTIGEVTSFSRQAMNIALALYWGIGANDKDKTLLSHCIPGINVTFEDVRYKVTKLVQAIHARDSRKPFTPPDHWLFSSQLDMRSFVSAAVIEEQEMLDPSELPPSRHRRDVTNVTPRLAVLNNVPFAIPFNVRVEMFRQFVRIDMMKNDRSERYFSRSRVVIRRNNVSADGFDKLGAIDLKGQVQITFVDEFGQEEAGIDGGGLFKEFFTSLCKEVFDTNRGLWLATSNNELYPNPHSYARESHNLEWYRFIGRILGKAMYEGILVDVAFAGFFLAKWLGKSSFLDDLASLDNELYKGLIFLKHYTGDCEDLSLTFSIDEEELGVTKIVDLIPNGRDIPVTKENRLQYIVLVCHYRLTKQIRQQSAAFFEGLSELVDPNWLRMFNQQELQILIGGVNSGIDLEDLRENTQYGGAYKNEHPTIEAFWKVVNTFTQEQRRNLLRFATSCSRPPLLGFKELTPKFSVAPSGNDQARLPTASTCVNLLKLPMYANEHILKQKLLQAINSGAGFNLS